MSHKHKITFIYPNNDSLEAHCETGSMLSDVAIAAGIEMTCKNACRVQLQAEEITKPTENERVSFSIEELENGYRYSDTYKVSQDMHVFLKLVRIKYIDSKGVCNKITAYESENMYELHRRTPEIDMSFACCGQLTCTTCFCEIFSEEKNLLSSLGSITDEEEDLMCTLDATPNSRLGCQCKFPLIVDSKIVVVSSKFRHKYKGKESDLLEHSED